ncbi:MAG: adenylate/guanylate cyclase domain-containing protein [Pseudomonadota bacterium]
MANATPDTGAAIRRADRYYAIERGLRLWSGVILFIFVLTHLLNHAVGVMGVEAMEAVQNYRVYVWRTWVGTAILYGAAAVHILLSLKRIVTRRTWRMPIQEALQIALGLAIPVLLYEHVLGTRYVAQFADVKTNYAATLAILWPGKAWSQIALLLVVWIHGVIGIHYAIRARNWFPRWREPLLVMAVLVPALAIAGFVSGGRDAADLSDPGATWTSEQIRIGLDAMRATNTAILLAAVAIALAIVIMAMVRRFGRSVRVRYVGHGSIDLPRGSTLLEGSRGAGIPHPSLCGGRARCSSCRVLVIDGETSLPTPDAAEAAMLKRISAPPRVRLACQIRPDRDLAVQILLPVQVGEGNVDWTDEALEWGTSRIATVLFVDLRGFTKLTENQLPYDLVVLLNRYIAEMRQAIEGNEGRVTAVMTDGMMAVFGLNGERGHGSRAAISAAEDMLRTAETLNSEFRAALSMPLRIGIGIHTGPIVIGRIGDDARGYDISVIGETVSIASRLEAATKEVLADCLISETAIEHARRSTVNLGMRRELNLPGIIKPIGAYGLDFATLSKARELEPAE